MKSDFKIIYKHLFIYLLKVVIAGIVIGLLYKQQTLLAILLGLKMISRINQYRREHENPIIPIIGLFVTGTLGTTIEYFGTKFGVWEYHDINSQLPHYLFFVWMAAFGFMYNLESKIFQNLPNATKTHKLMWAWAVVLIFPTIGEIITIYFGVWTYYFPLKFWGVSVYSIISIALVHIVINYCMSIYCKKKNIKDIVINP